MNIEHIFSKPLNRNINGVVKADQLDDHSVWVELDEYVVTNELDRHLRVFFENYLPAVQNPNDPSVAGNIGIWVSGFFGSGKSHFIKILSYLLENRDAVYLGETKKAVEFFKDKITDPMLFGDIHASVNRDTDVILFNIDSRANTTDKENAILKVFLKVFNERLGYCGDHPHIAHMERELDNRGQYQAFKDEFAELTMSTWNEERDAYDFYRDQMSEALSKASGQSEESTRQWVESLETNFPLDISNFCKWVKQYLDKSDDKNIIFLADEVGQFIGTNTQMMLKLQTITENLGTTCGGRAWIIVTSQEDIDAVLGDLKAKEGKDFSKIQGRFKTRISLSSSNTNEVIQKRLLLKTDEAKDELGIIFNQKGDILKNQLAFDSTTTAELANFNDNVDFIDNYPFVPYQYTLVQKVFESVRNAGATGKHLSRGERSLLDAFQNAAQQIKTDRVGALIPFYRFYPAIESFLDTMVKMTIDKACETRTLTDADGDVLKTLFLIRYVDVVKSTLDNLVTLSIEEIDSDKISLKKQIEESLNRLEREMLIVRNGNEYIFLTNEEKEIENEIRHTEIEVAKLSDKVSDLLLKEILKDQTKYHYPVNNQNFEISRFSDGVPKDSKSDNDLVLKIISPLQMGYGDYKQDSYCQTYSGQEAGCVLVRLGEDKLIWDELTTFMKTERYLQHNNHVTRPEQAKLLNEKALDNNSRGKRLKTMFTELALDASIFAIGNKLDSKGSSFSKIIDASYKYVIENSFRHLDMLKACDDPLRELKAVLKADDIDKLNIDLNDHAHNAEAIKELERYIQSNDELNRAMYLKDVLIHFSHRPYGWRREEVMLLIAKLGCAGKVSFTLSGEELALKRSYDAFISVRKHGELRIRRIRQHNDELLGKAKKLGKDLFHKPFNGGENELAAQFSKYFKQWDKDLKIFERQAGSVSECPGRSTIEDGQRLVAGILEQPNSYAIIERILQDANELDAFAEDFEDLECFFGLQFDTWKQLANALNIKFEANISVLEKQEDAAKALLALKDIYISKNPYKQLKNVAGFIEQVEKSNQALLMKKRDHTLERIAKRVALIEKELVGCSAPAELSNKALYALQNSRKIVEKSSSLFEITATQTDAQTHQTEALELINEYIAQQQRLYEAQQRAIKAREVAEKPGLLDVVKKTEITPANLQVPPMVKPMKTIDPLCYLMESGFVETQEEIEKYLEYLREELEEAIEQGYRVRLDILN
ncbi:BREX system P-loop protein BrxC [Photobacterium carnosum]|uniref:DNA repair protein n=1 Tax=Photobacterium carnosum TaxID=2023717 RepID=A0A2N4UM73_9GAMM|nr:BREX system P-loop protein BrxC [Photobacterium carnosum]PLC56104.1 DNA repair protein [Photobacterium carnosum]